MPEQQDGAAGDTQASMPAGAVFLSYASEDADAAERIATALRTAGVEVWFDKSELRSGDAWDRQIREQIHDSRLFIAVISAHTEGRDEGYFRREWKLAVDRTHDMDERKAFLVPVVIDATSEHGAHVPEKFRELQWTRLPSGETSPAFVDRVKRLLSPEGCATRGYARPVAGEAVTAAAPRRSGLTQSTRVLCAAVAAVALLALGHFGLERLNRTKPSVAAAASIAVLPLANESADSSQQYFSDGISEDLITALSQFPGLKVIGRTSAFQFRDSKEDSRSIGAKLGVARLLEGSVRRAGEMVRVSAELIDTADGSTQWSEHYDRAYKDFFALQDEITRAVASALRAKLLPAEHVGTQSERPPSGSLEAYNALLRGRFHVLRGTEADSRKAIEFYAQATQIDPRYALAWSELAENWAGLGEEFLASAPAREAYAKARDAAEHSLAIAPDLAAAHVAQGMLLQFADFDWHGAEAEFRRALELAPSNADAKSWYAGSLASAGKVEQAIELTRQTLETEPLWAGLHEWLAVYLSGLNRLDEAEPAVRRAIELQPAAVAYHYTLAIIEVQRGDPQAALAAAQRETDPGWRDTALALARQIGGDPSAAQAALRTLIESHAETDAFGIAEVYALRGDVDETFVWLDRAWTNRDAAIGGILFDPFILRFKDDPRFAAFCRKVGLPTPAEVGRRT
jgi:TolB-like protein/Tfp pilus assembly protein PilF